MRPGLVAVTALSFICGISGQQSCEDLGFKGTQSCLNCDRLQDYTKDSELHSVCKSCCIEDKDSLAAQRYDKAVLEVCQYRLSEFRNVESFISEHLGDWPNVKLSYRFGSPPKLVLKKDKQKETTRIDSWKTENILEFLESRLLPSNTS